MTKQNIEKFVPVSDSPTDSTGLGPGFYTTLARDMELAIVYAGYHGVLWVFSSPDLGKLDIRPPTADLWESMVGKSHSIPKHVNTKLPRFKDIVDAIEAPVSHDAELAFLMKEVNPGGNCEAPKQNPYGLRHY